MKSMMQKALVLVTILFTVSCSNPIEGSIDVGGTPVANFFLEDVSMDGVTFNQVFSPSVVQYTATVPNSMSSVDFHALVQTDAKISLKVGALIVKMSEASGTVPFDATLELAVGANVIKVTAESLDGAVSITYTLTITREAEAVLSAINTLSSLVLSGGVELAPVFAAGTTQYTATVPYSVASLTVTPTTVSAVSTVTVNSIAVVSGNASGSLALAVGSNPVSVAVTAENGAVMTYVVTVTRQTEEGGNGDGTIIIDPDLQDPIEITFNPSSITAEVGGSVTITASTSEAVTSYKWYIDEVLQAASGNSVTLNNLAADTTYKVKLLVSNATKVASKEVDVVVSNGSTTGTVTVTIGVDLQLPMTIAFSGQQSAITQGTTMTVQSTVSESGVTYQWYLNGEALAGQTASSIIVGTGLALGEYRLDLLVSKDTRISSNYLWFSVVQGQIDTVATPTFSVPAGAVSAGTTITLSTATSGATIYYTVDGSTPTTSSTQGTSVVVNAAMTVKAIAAKSGMNTSAVASAAYTIVVETVAAPTFSVAPGAVSAGTTVTISTTTAGATIYYTVDGSTPTTSSTQGTSVVVNASLTIKALAVKSGMTNSAVSSAAYTVSTTGGIIVHIPTSYSENAIHYWDVVATPAIANAVWGTPVMLTDADSDGWKDYTFANATAAKVLFRIVGGAQTPDFVITASGEYWVHWSNGWQIVTTKPAL